MSDDGINEYLALQEQIRALRVTQTDNFRAYRDQTLATRDLTDAIHESRRDQATLVEAIHELTAEIRAMRGEREARAEAKETGNGHHSHNVASLDDID